jgi:hypothetical protein
MPDSRSKEQTMIQTSSWTVRGWPAQLCQAHGAHDVKFAHAGTQIYAGSDPDTPAQGQTVWAGLLPPSDDSPARAVGVAWDWVQLTDDAVAMSDPMSVITNLRLLGEQGEVLTAWQAARHLSELVYGLPWQDEVRRALSKLATPAEHAH